MIVFKHTPTGKEIYLINEWRELTLDKAVKIRAVELPDITDSYEWFEHLDKIKKLWQLFTRSGVDPEEIIPSELVYYFIQYLLPMVQDLNSDYPKTYTPKLFTSFKHKGVVYYMPTSIQLGDDTILSHGQRARRFTEASNLLKIYSQLGRDGIKVMGQFVAAVVNEKESEQWSEERVIARGEAFKDLPMDVVWEVFFCTSALLYKQLKTTLNSLTGNRTTLQIDQENSIIYYLKSRKAALQAQLRTLIN
jgi:hypothetical protein